MSLFKHKYSGLITGGLGLPAAALFTFGFHLFSASVVVIPSKGGGYAVTPVYVNQAYTPVNNKMYIPGQKIVMITVKSGESTWRKMYTIDSKKADIVVNALNFGNSIKQRMHQIAESLKVTFK